MKARRALQKFAARPAPSRVSRIRSGPDPTTTAAGETTRRWTPAGVQAHFEPCVRGCGIPFYNGPSGRVAQWESARFTRERSQVRNPPRPLRESPADAALLSSPGDRFTQARAAGFGHQCPISAYSAKDRAAFQGLSPPSSKGAV